MFEFHQFLDHLKSDLRQIGREFGEDYVNDIIDDGCRFAQTIKSNLERRTKLLIDGELTKKEFEMLLKSDRSLLKMESLKQKGLVAIQRNKIKNAIIGSITGAVFKSLKL